MRQKILDNLKNIPGQRLKSKLVAFAVDDYGTVRINNNTAFQNIQHKYPFKPDKRMDFFDALETQEDLQALFEVLNSVKDQKGQPAVFTPYALSQNLDFEQMAMEDYQKLHFELLPNTFEKLAANDPAAYEGTYALVKEGVQASIFRPEFHGREHFNLKVVQEKLDKRDPQLLLSLQNRSLAHIGPSGYPSIGWTASYAFWDPKKDIAHFEENIRTGLLAFEQVYGYQASVFTPPAQQLPDFIEAKLSGMGLIGFDKPFYQAKHLGFGKYRKQFGFTRYNKKMQIAELVRNVVFEPTNSNINHVAKAMQQIEAAFRWGKPAIISSHRVNFCGHIAPKNREKGLGDLKVLLKAITTKWPDVEFVGTADIARMMLPS
jgi:hypothetical protein